MTMASKLTASGATTAVRANHLVEGALIKTPASIRASFENGGVFISVWSQTEGLSPALATIRIYVRPDINATHLASADARLVAKSARALSKNVGPSLQSLPFKTFEFSNTF